MLTQTRHDSTRTSHPILREDADVAEFERAIERYKRRSGWMFPAWSEILEVMRGLGYARPGAEPSRPPMVAIKRDGDAAARIGDVLAEWGGVPSFPGQGQAYFFDSEGDRAGALDAARSEFGLTCVEPL